MAATQRRRTRTGWAVAITVLTVLTQSLGLPGPASAVDVPTTVTIMASSSSSFRGEDFVLTATVSPNPGGGSVTFHDVGADRCLCGYPVDLVSGEADGVVRLFDLGERQLQAVFTGYGEYAASESTVLLHDVSQRPTETTLEIGEINDVGELDLTVRVTPVPDGGTFSIHAASGEVLVRDAPADVTDGEQAYTMRAPLPGTGPYTARYSGSFEYAPSSSEPMAWSDDRMATATTLTVTPTEGAPRDDFTFEAKVDPRTWSGVGAMGGVVRFFTSGQLAPWATVPVSGNGVATTTSTFVQAGAPTVYAEYSGDDTFVSSRSADVGLTIERIVTTTTLELSTHEIEAGESVTATVTVSPPPSHYPPNPVAGLTFTSRSLRSHFEAVAINPVTGIGQVVLSADELTPEVWTARARFGEGSARYVGSMSDPVELRFLPFGPSHTLSITPSSNLYLGDAATVRAVLSPVPGGGTVSLYAVGTAVGSVPVLLAMSPVGSGTVDFGVTTAQSIRYFTRFNGSAGLPASESAEFEPTLLQPPNTRLTAPHAWTFSPITELTFSPLIGSISPVTFECSLDAGPWTACTSPFTTPAMPDGPHTFAVRAADANNRLETDAAEVAWRIDTAAPVVTGVDVAPRSIADTKVTLTVTATDQTIGLHGGTSRVHVSMRPDVDESGRLQVSLDRPLGTFAFDLTAIQVGGSAVPGPKTIFLQVEDPFGHRAPTEQLTVPYDPDATHPFTDVATSTFEPDIEWVFLAGLTRGCAVDRYCPRQSMTRAEMASFLVRALDLPAATVDAFSDDTDSVHENAINRLAAAGITGGCGDGRYCPSAAVKRAEMASFLVRAFSLPPTVDDRFTDDEGSIHEGDINRLAAADITGGCSPTTFCPSTLVLRGQIAAFLQRALD